jgi:hypothetical protein
VKGCKNRNGFAMIMVIFMIILVGMMFIIIANASNVIAAQTKAVYKDAVKSNLAASEIQLKKLPMR